MYHVNHSQETSLGMDLGYVTYWSANVGAFLGGGGGGSVGLASSDKSCCFCGRVLRTRFLRR